MQVRVLLSAPIERNRSVVVAAGRKRIPKVQGAKALITPRAFDARMKLLDKSIRNVASLPKDGDVQRLAITELITEMLDLLNEAVASQETPVWLAERKAQAGTRKKRPVARKRSLE